MDPVTNILKRKGYKLVTNIFKERVIMHLVHCDWTSASPGGRFLHFGLSSTVIIKIERTRILAIYGKNKKKCYNRTTWFARQCRHKWRKEKKKKRYILSNKLLKTMGSKTCWQNTAHHERGFSTWYLSAVCMLGCSTGMNSCCSNPMGGLEVL